MAMRCFLSQQQQEAIITALEAPTQNMRLSLNPYITCLPALPPAAGKENAVEGYNFLSSKELWDIFLPAGRVGGEGDSSRLIPKAQQ